MSVEQTIQRCVLKIVIFFLRIGNVVDSFLNYFGIKLLRITRESVLKGLSSTLQKSMKSDISEHVMERIQGAYGSDTLSVV